MDQRNTNARYSFGCFAIMFVYIRRLNSGLVIPEGTEAGDEDGPRTHEEETHSSCNTRTTTHATCIPFII